MAQSHTGDGPTDEQLTTLPGLGEADEDDVEDVVDALTGHGPEDSAVVMSEGQAEALARRKFVGQSRQEAADAMDCSVWTVDGNLTRAKANLETVDEAALAFDAAGAFDLSRVDVVGSHSVDESDDLEAGDDGDVAAWGRLMTRDVVVKVIRPETSDYLALNLSREAEEDEVEAVKDEVEAVGYLVRGVEGAVDGGATIRAWKPGAGPLEGGDDEDDESDESGVESDEGDEADESPDEPDEPREVLLLGGEPVPSTTDRIADDVLEELAADVEESLEVDLENLENGETLGTVEFDPADGFEFDPADGLGADGDDGADEENVDEDDQDDDVDESDVYRCECGAEFDSAGGLGGHSRYCDGVNETEGSA